MAFQHSFTIMNDIVCFFVFIIYLDAAVYALLSTVCSTLELLSYL